MDCYAVIGHPIQHSKSPTIHQAFAQAAGHAIRYDKIEAPLGGFAETVDAFRAAGGLGVNVTVPFKTDACAYATDLAESARAAGAANALKFDGSRCWAENFDGIGLVRDLVDNLGHAVGGRRVLILGAGGATRGAILPLLAEAPEHLCVVNRTVDKATGLVASFHDQGAHPDMLWGCGYDALVGHRFDLVINATSASLTADLPPLPATVFTPDALAYDMVYGKGLTPFLRLAQEAGVRALADGVGMLVEQAAEAFAWWRGVRPGTRDVIRQLTVPLI